MRILISAAFRDSYFDSDPGWERGFGNCGRESR
jgi:hypothetical protein